MTDATRRSRSRRPTFIAAVLVVLAAALASKPLVAAGMANLKGKVAGWEKLLPQVYADASKNDARRYNWREPSPTVKQEFRKLSANVSRDVCVVAISPAGNAQPHDPIPVKVTGGRTSFATVVLSPGSRLSLKNVDPFPHVLFEVGNPAWAPNAVAPGSAREWAAAAPGLHVIKDQQFSSIVMYVVVDPGAVEFAMPDHEGGYAMVVPPGEYVLRAFFDGKPVGKDATVRLGPGGLDMKEPIALGGMEAKSAGDSKAGGDPK